MERQPSDPQMLSEDTPSPARMYNYFLGGYRNLAADRQAAAAILAIYPDTVLAVRANRDFVRRVIHFLLDQGIDQFLDIGAGIPSTGNVHTVAHAVNPEARVVYVDVDPVVIAHCTLLAQNNPNIGVVENDARRMEQIFHHPNVLRLLDFTRPVGVLVTAMLQFVTEDAQVASLLQTLRDTIAAGSFIAISHPTYPPLPSELIAEALGVYARSTNPVRLRSFEEIEALFSGLEVVEPGLVYAPHWRPENGAGILFDRPERSLFFGGVGRR